MNRQFYQTFGREFSSTRRRLQPGVKRVLDMLNGDETLLDLGCGNGELARERIRRGHSGRTIGLDFSTPLLEEARTEAQAGQVILLQADLTDPDWDTLVRGHIPAGHNLDAAVCFAVLHHIPGADLRLVFLRKVRNLLETGGKFFHSEWQFLNSPKLTQRIQPWHEAGLGPEDVEADDYLLDWRAGGRGLRYVHHFTEPELESLAGPSRFRITQTFYSDGENDRLGLYQIWEAV